MRKVYTITARYEFKRDHIRVRLTRRGPGRTRKYTRYVSLKQSVVHFLQRLYFTSGVHTTLYQLPLDFISVRSVRERQRELNASS